MKQSQSRTFLSGEGRTVVLTGGICSGETTVKRIDSKLRAPKDKAPCFMVARWASGRKHNLQGLETFEQTVLLAEVEEVAMAG